MTLSELEVDLLAAHWPDAICPGPTTSRARLGIVPREVYKIEQVGFPRGNTGLTGRLPCGGRSPQTKRAQAAFLDSGTGLMRYTLSRLRWRKIRTPIPRGQTISTAVCHTLNARYSAAVWYFPQLPE
jgi:hypothetical protein